MELKQLLAVALLAIGGSAWAQAPLIRQAGMPEGATSATIAELQGKRYTLLVTGTAGTKITLPSEDGKGAYSYTPEVDGTVRFVKRAGVMYVYEGDTYKDVITPTNFTYTSITKDNVTDAANLLSNPSFETIGSVKSGTKYNIGTPWTWSIGSADIRVQNNNNSQHGSYVLVWRGSANNNYISQPLTTLKPNTKYEVKMQQVASGNANANFYVGIGAAAGGYELASTTVKLGTNNDGVKTLTITTSATIENGTTYYFTFKNTSNNTASSGSDPVSQIDWMSLVEVGSLGVDGATVDKFVNNAAYAPESIEYTENTDATSSIINAAVTSTTGWTNGRTNTGQQYTEAPDNTYFDTYNETRNMYQDITELPKGHYSVKCATRGIATLGTANIYVSQNGKNIASTDIHKDGNTDGELGNGWSWTTVNFDLNDDGSVRLGFYSECGSSKWAGADNFTLTYTPFSQNELDAAAIAAAKENLRVALTQAPNITTNIGAGAFQYPTAGISAINTAKETAQGVYDDAEASLAAVNEQLAIVEALAAPALNAPTAGQRFHLNLDGKGTTTFVASQSAQSGYSVTFNATESNNYSQAFELTPVAGAAENDMYTISFTDNNGETRYICNGIPYNAGTGAYGIRTITDSEKALVVKVVATATGGEYNILNTSTDGGYKKLGSNGGDLYTDDKYSTFTISAAQQATANLNITAAKYGTFIAPFAATIPSGVTAYKVSELDGDVLTLVEDNDGFDANTPYIVYSESVVYENLEGWGLAKQGTYTEGLLTGVYAATSVEDGWYVLQNNNNKVGFYLVDTKATEDPTPSDLKVGANRCYLTQPAAGARVRALYFGDKATGINAEAAADDAVEAIYNANGTVVSALQPGLNIVKMKSGKVQKVLVK